MVGAQIVRIFFNSFEELKQKTKSCIYMIICGKNLSRLDPDIFVFFLLTILQLRAETSPDGSLIPLRLLIHQSPRVIFNNEIRYRSNGRVMVDNGFVVLS